MRTSRTIDLNIEDFLVFNWVGVSKIPWMMTVSKLIRTGGRKTANKSSPR
jgi:hypothetical protein